MANRKTQPAARKPAAKKAKKPPRPAAKPAKAKAPKQSAKRPAAKQKKPAARKSAAGKKIPANAAHKKPKAKPVQTKTPNDVSVVIKRHRDKNGGHNHVIVGNVDDRHVSVGLTTKVKKGNNSPNYTLEKSPLQDGKQSYMRRQGSVYPQKEYYDERRGAMTKKDYTKAQEYGERAKQKYIAEKAKKSNEVPNISKRALAGSELDRRY